MRRYHGTAAQLSPIARKQQQLYGYGGLGAFGLTGTTGGAIKGAQAGASVGSVIPIAGTAIGAIAGAIGGAIAGSINKKDPEQYNFDSVVNLWQQNPNAVYNIANKYLPLAGLFDLSLAGTCQPGHGCIPIYAKYNRMGEERFTHDLAMVVYTAAQNGQITGNDTPLSIMANVVQPWISGFGFPPMSDPHQDLIQKLIVGMIADYVSGAAPQIWRAVGGDLPASFSSIPPFSLPVQPAAPAVTATIPPALVTPTTPSVNAPSPIVSVPTPPAAPTVATAVPIPAGYILAGSANGLSAYSDPNGVIYSWNGVQMLPLTGTLLYSNGSSASVSNGQVIPQGTVLPLPSGYQSPLPPSYQPPPSGYQPPLPSAAVPTLNMPSGYGGPSYSTAAPPTTASPVAAGVSGLPSWVTYGAIGTVLYLMFAGGRIQKGKGRSSAGLTP